MKTVWGVKKNNAISTSQDGLAVLVTSDTLEWKGVNVTVPRDRAVYCELEIISGLSSEIMVGVGKKETDNKFSFGSQLRNPVLTQAYTGGTVIYVDSTEGLPSSGYGVILGGQNNRDFVRWVSKGPTVLGLNLENVPPAVGPDIYITAFNLIKNHDANSILVPLNFSEYNYLIDLYSGIGNLLKKSSHSISKDISTFIITPSPNYNAYNYDVAKLRRYSYSPDWQVQVQPVLSSPTGNFVGRYDKAVFLASHKRTDSLTFLSSGTHTSDNVVKANVCPVTGNIVHLENRVEGALVTGVTEEIHHLENVLEGAIYSPLEDLKKYDPLSEPIGLSRELRFHMSPCDFSAVGEHISDYNSITPKHGLWNPSGNVIGSNIFKNMPEGLVNYGTLGGTEVSGKLLVIGVTNFSGFGGFPNNSDVMRYHNGVKEGSAGKIRIHMLPWDEGSLLSVQRLYLDEGVNRVAFLLLSPTAPLITTYRTSFSYSVLTGPLEGVVVHSVEIPGSIETWGAKTFEQRVQFLVNLGFNKAYETADTIEDRDLFFNQGDPFQPIPVPPPNRPVYSVPLAPRLVPYRPRYKDWEYPPGEIRGEFHNKLPDVQFSAAGNITTVLNSAEFLKDFWLHDPIGARVDQLKLRQPSLSTVLFLKLRKYTFTNSGGFIQWGTQQIFSDQRYVVFSVSRDPDNTPVPSMEVSFYNKILLVNADNYVGYDESARIAVSENTSEFRLFLSKKPATSYGVDDTPGVGTVPYKAVISRDQEEHVFYHWIPAQSPDIVPVTLTYEEKLQSLRSDPDFIELEYFPRTFEGRLAYFPAEVQAPYQVPPIPLGQWVYRVEEPPRVVPYRPAYQPDSVLIGTNPNQKTYAENIWKGSTPFVDVQPALPVITDQLLTWSSSPYYTPPEVLKPYRSGNSEDSILPTVIEVGPPTRVSSNEAFSFGLADYSWGSPYRTGDVLGIAIDSISGKVWFSRNGVWQGNGEPSNNRYSAYSVGANEGLEIFLQMKTLGNEVKANFGSTPFQYSIPNGFSPLDNILYDYHIEGKVTKLGVNAGRTVLLLDRSENTVVGKTESDSTTGAYRFDSVRGDREYCILALPLDNEVNSNTVAIDHATPTPN